MSRSPMIVQLRAHGRDGCIVGVEQPSLGEERMHERIADGAFGDLAEIGARHQHRVDVDAVGVEGQVAVHGLLVVDSYQQQVDVGLGPDGVVGQAAAEDGGQNGPVVLDLLDEYVQSIAEFLPDGARPWLITHASNWRRLYQPHQVTIRTMDPRGLMNSLFSVPRALIGVIHVAALPGTPGARLDVAAIAEAAVAEARMYEAAGFHALAIENTHDRPYLKSSVGPEITAAMSVIGCEVRRAVALPLGVQILAGANLAALAVAHACGAAFVRVEGFVFAHVADEG